MTAAEFEPSTKDGKPVATIKTKGIFGGADHGNIIGKPEHMDFR